ncbi:helix-turn-helix domain-containing protein [Pantoea sp.]|uniref:helix-turn-helix domain-containing protein n=1 Tax=Pantoea sp. TaxID=69393 RepID=UPI0028ADD5C9|nr:helix-turn-helix domain-containing protein [Pantoea sp.]
MSIKLMNQAFGIRVGSHLRKLILIKIADNASDQGECWPSHGYLADQCECSKSAVREHIDALIQLGLLEKENRLGGNSGKGNQSNVYRLKLDNPMPSESTPPVPPKSIAMSPDDTPYAATRHPLCRHAAPEPSLEPSIESKKNIGTSEKSAEPKRNAKREYSPEFETAWHAYPKRAGGNPKPSAWKAWSGRIREGAKPDDMIAGVIRYAAWVLATGKLGTEYVKQAATFFGPDRHFDEAWEVPRGTGFAGSGGRGNFGAISPPDKTIPDGFTGYLP